MTLQSASPIDVWHELLRADVELDSVFHRDLVERMRAARLTFGDRLLCPFLRPFFLTDDDELRVRVVSETIAAAGERVVKAAMEDASLFADVGMEPGEERLARLEPRYDTASTASRLDSFLLPESLQFAEYNAESPAGAGYAEGLSHIFRDLPVMRRFEERYQVRGYRLKDALLDALMASYREWGGVGTPTVAIVDWREVPTWTEFEMLRDHFEQRGVPTVVSDPRDLVFEGGRLRAAERAIDFVYRRVLINDIVARPAECAALVSAYEAGAVCVANTFRCKIPHKKAFFAVLTDERRANLFSPAERQLFSRHVPWTRLVREGHTPGRGTTVDLLPYISSHRDHLVLKPNDEYGGAGVTLGWEMSQSDWDLALNSAANSPQAWVVQERIGVRRELFPQFDLGAVAVTDPGSRDARSSAGNGSVTVREMLVDLAPYLFRGKLSGFLTRLSATGLANVTSGGGQVPSFVVKGR